MSSTAFNTSLDLSPGPSVRAILALSVLHMGAVVLVVLAQLPKPASLAMALLLLASWFTLRRHPAFGFGPRALHHLILHAAGGWSVESVKDGRGDAELLDGSVVQSWIIVLNFRLKSGRKRSRVLLGDELPADAMRRLRARLLADSGGAQAP
jgi:toxin CptA